MNNMTFRRKVLKNLFFYPTIIFLVGLIFLVSSFEGPRFYRFPALGFICFALIFLLARMTIFFDSIVQSSFKQLVEERQKSQDRELDDLMAKLSMDNEPRNEDALLKLRSIYKLFSETVQSGVIKEYDFLDTAEKLFKSCIVNLRGNYARLQSAIQLPAESRNELLKQGEQLLREVESSIASLTEALVEIQNITSPDQDELLGIREELEERLDVAKKVEERIRSKGFLHTPIE